MASCAVVMPGMVVATVVAVVVVVVVVAVGRWPGSSPYVTAVGATEEYTVQGATFSGGGYSNRYGVPAYQADAIAAYKAATRTSGPPDSYYNTSGAGFPDVAAVGLNYWTYVGGTPTEVRVPKMDR